MFSKTALLALVALPLAVFANPIPATEATCAYTCGSVCYYQSDVTAALNQGYGYYKQGKTVGSNDYPHSYENYEGFDITVAGPYEEFPILSSYQVYTGGSPGADRVVFNTKGVLADVVTHTGASGDDFVECKKA